MSPQIKSASYQFLSQFFLLLFLMTKSEMQIFDFALVAVLAEGLYLQTDFQSVCLRWMSKELVG
jgi:hypothetical protein